MIVMRDLDEAAALSNRVAPEHLELCVADPEALAEKITHAGAIFLGAWTPEAIGDYVGGPNHVLPTARSARFSSGLSVLDFMKRTTLAQMTPEALRRDWPRRRTSGHLGKPCRRMACLCRRAWTAERPSPLRHRTKGHQTTYRDGQDQ